MLLSTVHERRARGDDGLEVLLPELERLQEEGEIDILDRHTALFCYRHATGEQPLAAAVGLLLSRLHPGRSSRLLRLANCLGRPRRLASLLRPIVGRSTLRSCCGLGALKRIARCSLAKGACLRTSASVPLASSRPATRPPAMMQA